MSEQLRESLSALMDGEASAFEVHRVLDEVRRDTQLRAVWARWQRVSAALHGGAAPFATDLADRVWMDFVNDPATNVATGQTRSGPERNWRPLAAWVAASAAAVAVIVVTQFATLGGDGEAPAQQTALVQQASSVPEIAVRAAAPAPQRPLTGGLSADARNVNVYMLQHMQQKAVNQPDVGAFTKLVTFEPDPQR